MNMKRTLVVVSLLLGISALAAAQSGQVLLNAAGATFPYPIYSKWFDVYHTAHPNVQSQPSLPRLAQAPPSAKPSAGPPSTRPPPSWRPREERKGLRTTLDRAACWLVVAGSSI